MGKGEETRDRIVAFGLNRAAVEGLDAITLGATAARLQMSKSGLFAHFGSKDALQVAIIERAIERFRAKVVEPALGLAGARAQLDSLLSSFMQWMDGDEEIPGCPFVLALQDFRDRPGEVRDALTRSELAWRGLLVEKVSAAQREGGIVRKAAATQIVFELLGVIFSYQVAKAILDDGQAPRRADEAFQAILDRA